MIKIYGSPQSSAGRCYWCLEEIGLKYERMPIDMRQKEHKSPEYLKLNPNGKVPTLVDDDLIVWESMAINLYLGDKYKQQLIGATVKDRAKIRQWSFWALAELQPAIIDLFIQEKFVPADKRDNAVIERALKKLPTNLQILDGYLAGKSFLVANDFTMADLNVASVVNITQAINYDIKPYANIVAWLKGVCDRPSYARYMKMCEQ